MRWQSEVVAYLRMCKDAGMDFDGAWYAALERHPPRGTGFGNGRKQLSFEDDGEPTLVQFLEQACRTAWHNERPELAGLSMDLLDVPSGGSRFTRTAQHATF